MTIDHINLSCASCGGQLEITEDLERFACSYCGAEQIVKRSGGVVSLSLAVKKLDGIKVGVDRTASELAIKRLKDEIISLEKNKKSIINDKDETTKSMRFFAKIFIIVGIIGLLGLSDYFSNGTFRSLIFVIPGIICTIISIMIYRSSLVYSSQSDDKVNNIEKSIERKREEIEIRLKEVEMVK